MSVNCLNLCGISVEVLPRDTGNRIVSETKVSSVASANMESSQSQSYQGPVVAFQAPASLSIGDRLKNWFAKLCG